jgi:sarcosine oxidase subunit gamma
MSEPAAVSPLAGAVAEAGLAIRLAEAGPTGMVALRGQVADPAFRAAVEGVAGLPVPGVRKAALAGDRRLLWMSPDELLLVLPYAEAPAAAAAFDARFAGAHHLAVVVSDARALFRLGGDAAREVIAKGAPVDLSRAAFGVGDFRRTHLGQVACAFWQVAERPDAFELVCFRSVAGYVFDWLAAAAAPEAMPGVL